MSKPDIGSIGWLDLTIGDAENLRDFYKQVVGWSAEPVDMGDYDDFNMCSDQGPQAGVCHKRGANAEFPAAWIPYIVVEDLTRSLEASEEGGGSTVVGPKKMGGSGSYAVIRDPAGAYLGLFEHAADS